MNPALAYAHQRYIDEQAEMERADKIETYAMRILQSPAAITEVSAMLDPEEVFAAMEGMVLAYKDGSVGADVGALGVFRLVLLPMYEKAAAKLAEEMAGNSSLAKAYVEELATNKVQGRRK